MKPRRKPKREPKPDSPKVKLIKTILCVGFFTGLVLLIFEIDIYRITFIPLSLLLSIWFLIGLLATVIQLFFITGLKPAWPGKIIWIFIFPIIYNTVTFGGILISIFMMLNFFFTTPKATSEKLAIKGYSSMARSKGCRQPLVYVNYKGAEKELAFPCSSEATRYKFVQLSIKKGLWGFEVITSKELSN